MPERLGLHEYWTRQTAERPQPCYMRRPAMGSAGSFGAPGARTAAGAEEEVVLDCNELARRLGGDSVGHVRCPLRFKLEALHMSRR